MDEADSRVIYTLGHSSHPLERVVALLREHGVGALVDVRSHPYSRWAPQYVKAALESGLGAAGVDYVYLGRELGGRPAGGADGEERSPRRVFPNVEAGSRDYARRALAPEFVSGIERLVALAQGRRVAILCAEEDPSRCHRRLLVTPALLQRGLAVVHIRADGRLESEEALARGDQLGLFG